MTHIHITDFSLLTLHLKCSVYRYYKIEVYNATQKQDSCYPKHSPQKEEKKTSRNKVRSGTLEEREKRKTKANQESLIYAYVHSPPGKEVL